MTLAVGIVFLLVQLAIGVWASRRVETESDFFLAGRRLGPGLVTISLFATWFGAETCLGSSGAVYAEGLSGARADPLGYCLCLVLLGAVLAKGLHRGRFLTLGDLYRQRFDARVERLAVLLLIPSGLVWGAAQVRAFGQVLSSTTDLPVTEAVWVAALVSIVYTFFGGLLGDVLTDVFQGMIVVLGLVALTYLVVSSAPSGTLASASAGRLSLISEGESWWAAADRWSVPVLGSLVAQELASRVLAARSEITAKRGAYGAAGLYLLVGSLPVLLGLMGPELVPELEEPEQLLLVLAGKYLGPVLALIFSFALLAAILSTVDSILLSTAALAAHNLAAPLLGLQSETAKLRASRAFVVLGGMFCLFVALSADSIYSLVEMASTIGTSGILVITLAGLFDPRPTRTGAGAALIVGALATPLFEFLGLGAPYLSSIFAAAFAYFALRGQRSSARTENNAAPL